MPLKTVFVTVGTTNFNELIQTLTKPDILKTLSKLGYTRLLLQIGTGSFKPLPSNIITVDYYRFKPSIDEDIQNASLVISHAGAGSCLEILLDNKPLIAIVNEELMSNHQMELAKALYNKNYLEFGFCKNLKKILLDKKYLKLEKYVPGKPEKFSNYLDKSVGFSE